MPKVWRARQCDNRKGRDDPAGMVHRETQDSSIDQSVEQADMLQGVASKRDAAAGT